MIDAITDLNAGKGIPADCAPIEFSSHSLDRLNTRVVRALDEERAYRSACAILAQDDAVVNPKRPAWIKGRQHGYRGAFAWLSSETLGVAFPLMLGENGALIAKTTLADREAPVGATVRVIRGRRR